ncbi:hypothetical protein [Kibdelosporangium philippinense]|uniref:hypothetical protein n=1 Tax=Kibdelosporangium philippinense TaxID=211113 RepID=UPI00361115DD
MSRNVAGFIRRIQVFAGRAGRRCLYRVYRRLWPVRPAGSWAVEKPGERFETRHSPNWQRHQAEILSSGGSTPPDRTTPL